MTQNLMLLAATYIPVGEDDDLAAAFENIVVNISDGDRCRSSDDWFQGTEGILLTGFGVLGFALFSTVRIIDEGIDIVAAKPKREKKQRQLTQKPPERLPMAVSRGLPLSPG
jgi:hypothetical protein